MFRISVKKLTKFLKKDLYDVSPLISSVYDTATVVTKVLLFNFGWFSIRNIPYLGKGSQHFAC